MLNASNNPSSVTNVVHTSTVNSLPEFALDPVTLSAMELLDRIYQSRDKATPFAIPLCDSKNPLPDTESVLYVKKPFGTARSAVIQSYASALLSKPNGRAIVQNAEDEISFYKDGKQITIPKQQQVLIEEMTAILFPDEIVAAEKKENPVNLLELESKSVTLLARNLLKEINQSKNDPSVELGLPLYNNGLKPSVSDNNLVICLWTGSMAIQTYDSARRKIKDGMAITQDSEGNLSFYKDKKEITDLNGQQALIGEMRKYVFPELSKKPGSKELNDEDIKIIFELNPDNPAENCRNLPRIAKLVEKLVRSSFDADISPEDIEKTLRPQPEANGTELHRNPYFRSEHYGTYFVGEEDHNKGIHLPRSKQFAEKAAGNIHHSNYRDSVQKNIRSTHHDSVHLSTKYMSFLPLDRFLDQGPLSNLRDHPTNESPFPSSFIMTTLIKDKNGRSIDPNAHVYEVLKKMQKYNPDTPEIRRLRYQIGACPMIKATHNGVRSNDHKKHYLFTEGAKRELETTGDSRIGLKTEKGNPDFDGFQKIIRNTDSSFRISSRYSSNNPGLIPPKHDEAILKIGAPWGINVVFKGHMPDGDLPKGTADFLGDKTTENLARSIIDAGEKKLSNGKTVNQAYRELFSDIFTEEELARLLPENQVVHVYNHPRAGENIHYAGSYIFIPEENKYIFVKNKDLLSTF